MSLLVLPTELLAHVFSYLDWDRTRSLHSEREDVMNAGLTCRQLRRALLPIMFRDVTLRLQWADGGLLEPRLLRLRRERPELAKHIRCIYIRTDYEHCLHCLEKEEDWKPFIVPGNDEDWLHPLDGSQGHSEYYTNFRTRADKLARHIHADQHAGVDCDDQMTAEGIVRQCKSQLGSSTSSNCLDALSIVMLCIPATTHTIVFKSLIESRAHESRNGLALCVLATAMELLHERLQDLTMLANAAMARRRNTSVPNAGVPTGPDAESSDALTADLIKTLSIRRLVFAANDEFSSVRNASASLAYQGFDRWHSISHSVRELDLRYGHSYKGELLDFIKGFDSLRLVRIQSFVLSLPHRLPPQQRQNLEIPVWLGFAIDLRRAMPHTHIELRNLHRPASFDPLPECAVRWILSQAVPRGVLIDVDREGRLLEDFASFMPLWWAEEGNRGSEALKNWNTQRAELSDAAMSRRWR